MPEKNKKVKDAFRRLALPLLKVGAHADDDGQVSIRKAPLPLGTAELKIKKSYQTVFEKIAQK